MMVLVAYPSFSVIDGASPAVSTSVIAKILMTRNASVTGGTLLKTPERTWLR
jgi:hypothetical protein